MTCPRCRAPAADDGNFCTGCGHALQSRPATAVGTASGAMTAAPARGARTASAAPSAAVPAPTPPGQAAPGPRDGVEREVRQVELVACPTCGATNAGSRERCGRCHAELAGGRAPLVGRAEVFAAEPEGTADEPERDSAVPRALVAVVVVAAVTVAVVVVALLGARGMGWFAPSEAVAALEQGTRLPVADATASSQLAGNERTFGPPDNLLDDDPESAWVEGVDGVGTGEWVQLRLDGTASVARVVVWNGHQRGELFTVSNRVAALRIDVGGRSFTSDLLDQRGPQAIDLPEPVRGDRVRLTVERVSPGERGTDTAISEVDVYGEPAG